jgi:serine/threonine-protein kinase
MDTTVADQLLGTLVDGRYRVRTRVARGGMATVYTAMDERLERTVALKIIHPSQAGDPQFLDRFTDEAKTIARLTHPNVVAVYDQGTHAGMPYLIMEYVRGRTLRDILAERRRLNPVEALAILEQMLAAIAAAHRAGLVHRDVKPENVLVAAAPSGGSANLVDAVVKVADFGLARAVEASADAGEDSGHLLATVAYVAPELVTDGHADPRTDVYSAGIVLFEMLTGRVPYDAEQAVDVAWQHVDRDVPPPSKLVAALPSTMDDLVGRATRRDPGARPTDAGAMLVEVQAARDDLGTANASTAVLHPITQPTVPVPSVQPTNRPSWARLPSPRPPGRRRSAPDPGPSWGDRMHHVRRQLARGRGGTVALVAVIAVLTLLVAGGSWWFAFGRYTNTPSFGALSLTAAQQKAASEGFTLQYDGGRFDERIPKDTVLAQRPGPGERVVRGATITLTLSLGPERYVVPDVIGFGYDLAASELEKFKLVPIRANDLYHDTLPSGSVITVDPKPGTELKPGDKVTVTVSKGRAPLTVPYLIGKNINDVRQTLQGMGLLVEVEEVDSPKPQGEVLEQTPPAETGIEPGKTVKLKVSKGPPQVAVPQVIGLPCDQGKQTLESAGLQVQVAGPNSTGVVANQDPGPGSTVPAGTVVTIFCP